MSEDQGMSVLFLNLSNLCWWAAACDDFHIFAVYPSDQNGLLTMWLSEKPACSLVHLIRLGLYLLLTTVMCNVNTGGSMI